MRLAEIETATVQRAIDLFLEVAYPENPTAHRPPLQYEGAPSVERLIEQFQDESHYTEDELSRRYILRLGNHAYPHMKFVLEEFIVRGEYYFTVDSHDGMVKLQSTSPDFQAWQKIRSVNSDIKNRIELRWQEEGIPTFRDLKSLVTERDDGQARRKGRILIIEDESDVAETTKAILTVNGYDVDVACDGAEGLEKIARERPDVVLLDLMLPGMDGYEVCAKIKNNERTKDLPVLLVTARTGEMIATRQADGFLAKPFKQEILLSFVNHLLNPPPPAPDD